MLLLISASTLKINAQIWFEHFPEGNGTTIDPQGKWTLSTPFGNNGTFNIQNFSLVANNLFYGPAIFTSQSINISSYSRVYISLKVRETGVMDHFQDSISLYYRLDGGPEILWGSESDDFDNNSQTWVTESVGNISGSALQIIVKMRNGDNDEHFYLDDVGVYSQPTLYSIQSGNWNNNLTWSYTRTGASCGCQTDALTTAVVQTSNTVNINDNVATAELVVENGGNVRWTAADFNLSMKNNGILNVKTGGILTRNGFSDANVVIDEEWKSGQIISDGTLSISSVLLSNYQGGLTFSGTSSMDINQSVSINGDGTGFDNRYEKDPRITVTNNLGGSLNIGVSLGVAAGQSGNMTFNNYKTVNLTGIFDNITSSSLFYNLTGATWNYGGSNFDTDIRLYSNYNSNLFNYVRSGDQSIISPVDAYWNITSSGSGTKTLSGNTTVNGNLSIKIGTSLQLATRDFSVNGTTSISGIILDNSSTGTARFVGLVAINAGGIWDFSAGNDACEFRGGLTHSGASFSSGTGTYSFITNSQTLGGSANIRFDGAVTVTGVTLNNVKTTAIAGILSGTGTWNNNSGAVLNNENAVAPAVTTFTVDANPNTVNYTGSGNQVIRTTTYHHLIVSTSGNKSFGGTMTVNGNMNIENSAVLQNSGSNDINLAGNWTDNNTADGFMEGTGEVFFNGTTEQTITKAGAGGAEGFYDITLNNSNGLYLASGDLNLTHQFSFAAGNITFANNSYKVYLSAVIPASLIYTSGRITGKFERGINTTGTYLFPIGTTINYNPANLVINAATVTGSVLAEFISGSPGNSGLPITEGGVEVSDAYTDGYWSFTARNGFSEGDYNINLSGTGFSTAIFDITRIIKRTAGGNWGFDGTHANASGSVCYRNNITGGISTTGTQFGFGHTRPLITDQPHVQIVCENASVSFSIIATGYSLTYQWFKAPGTSLTNDGHYGGVTTSTLSITNAVIGDAGNYYCIVTDGYGSTVQSTSSSLTVNAIPVPIITGAGSICGIPSAGNIYSTEPLMSGYTWTVSAGGTITSGAGTKDITVTWTTSGAKTVTVNYTNGNGCTATSPATYNVTVNPLPVATVSNNGPVCAGTPLTLTGPAGMTTYSWAGPLGYIGTFQSPTVSANATVAMAGTYSLIVTNAVVCTNTATTTVVINALPLVNITSSSSSMCINDLRTLTGSPAGGTFSISSGPGSMAENVLTATGAGNIGLEYKYTGVCTNMVTQSIIVNENPIAIAGTDQKLEYVFETQMNAELSSSETGEWSLISGSGNISDKKSPVTSVTGLSIGENLFLWKVNNGSCEGTDEVVIEVNDVVAPTVITPNEDGLNDEMIFPGLIAFPGSTIIIYNRWGGEVYRSTDYKNDWKGEDLKKRELQEDTYFYILRISNGQIIKGFVEIIR